MGQIEVSQTCQSCKHANFKTVGYGNNKRKTGWCMLYTSPEIIPEPSDIESILYNESKNNSRLMPFGEFLNTIKAELDRYQDYYPYYSTFGDERLREIWNKFEENFLWWNANREKLKKIHILNYCCDHERAKNEQRTPSRQQQVMQNEMEK